MERIQNFLLAATAYSEQPSIDFRGYRYARLNIAPAAGSPASVRLSSNESLTKSSTKNSLYSIPVVTSASENLNLDGVEDTLFFWVDSGSVVVSVIMWGCYDE